VGGLAHCLASDCLSLRGPQVLEWAADAHHAKVLALPAGNHRRHCPFGQRFELAVATHLADRD
ncbi:unnamed protein product, partial [Symbiodinium sp. CCMP2456]